MRCKFYGVLCCFFVVSGLSGLLQLVCGGSAIAAESAPTEQMSANVATWSRPVFLRAFSQVLLEEAQACQPGYRMEINPDSIRVFWNFRERPAPAGSGRSSEWIPGAESIEFEVELCDQAGSPVENHPNPRANLPEGDSRIDLLAPVPVPGLEGTTLKTTMLSGEKVHGETFRRLLDLPALLARAQQYATQSPKLPAERSQITNAMLYTLQTLAGEAWKNERVQFNVRADSVVMSTPLYDTMVTRPTGKDASGVRHDREGTPFPNGLLLEVRIADAGTSLQYQAKLPQTLRYPAKLASAPDLPQAVKAEQYLFVDLLRPFPVEHLKAEIIANLSYGSQTDKALVEKFSSPARWLGGPVGADGRAAVAENGAASGFAVPADWSKDVFFDALTVSVNELAARKLPGYELKKSGRRLVLSWRLRECAVTRPKYFAGSDEKRIDHELAPVPEGVKLTVWLSDENLSQAMRPQTVDYPAETGVLYLLLGQELPIPELKAFLFFNLEYGEATDKQLVREFSDPQDWLAVVQRNIRQAGEPPASREALFGRLLSGLQREAEKRLPGYDLTLSGGELRIDWRLHPATVLFPAGKALDSGMREEGGMFPIPEGVRLSMRLVAAAALKNMQHERSFDRPEVSHFTIKTMDVSPVFTGQREGSRLARLYGGGGPYPVAGQMLDVVVDLEYGDYTAPELIPVFSSPKRWLGGAVEADGK